MKIVVPKLIVLDHPDLWYITWNPSTHVPIIRDLFYESLLTPQRAWFTLDYNRMKEA